MTVWLLGVGWNWLLVPVGLWLAWKFWLATREQPLKYLQHTTLTRRSLADFTEADGEWLSELASWLRWKHIRDTKPRPGPPISQARHLLDVTRRERMFPWRRHSESWLVTADSAVRESDGLVDTTQLHKRFLGMIAVAEARKDEVEELT